MATPNVKTRVLHWLGGGVLGVATTLLVPHLCTEEGFRPVVYRDPVGIKTYCYGETSNPEAGRVYSKEYCDYLVSTRAREYVHAVRDLVPLTVSLSPEELAAWGSFTYNIGLSQFKQSTAYKLLKQGRRRLACRQLPRWVYGDGKRLPGLVRRRAVELAMCLKGVDSSEGGSND